MTDRDFGIGKKISVLYRHNRIFLEKKLRKHGIGSGQYTFLFYLYGRDGITQDDLSKAYDVDKATTARALKKLEDGGFIRREVDPQDRRANNIYLTQKSLDIKEEIHAIKLEWQSEVVKSLTPEEIETFVTLLGKISVNAVHCIHHKEDSE